MTTREGLCYTHLHASTLEQHSMSNHAPLDEDDLRLALLDDDLRALEALDAGVDLADAGCRPSALLDRRMEDEFGGAFFSSCLRASELLSSDSDAAADCALLDSGGATAFVDMEQMLLSESEAFLSAHFGGGATMDEMLRRLDGEDARGAVSEVQGLRAELTAQHFRHTLANSDTYDRLVLLKQAIAAGSASAIFNMPPRYFESAASSPQKRRVHRRTFGERQHTFAFSGATSEATASVKYENSSVVPLSAACVVATPRDERVRIKDESVGIAAAAPVPVAVPAVAVVADPVAQDQDVEMEQEDDDAEDDELFRAFTPVPAPSFVGFRSITDDCRLETDDAAVASLRTPLRPTLSQEPAQQRTPLPHQTLASRSMSPADAFDKVAGLVQVARDSPGRLGQFEWRIGDPQAAHIAASQRTPATMTGLKKRRPTLAAQLGSADTTDDWEEKAESVCGEVAVAVAAPLPPRYFRGGTSSPQKRRAHSTTFGSFARSFSFTGSAPSDS